MDCVTAKLPQANNFDERLRFARLFGSLWPACRRVDDGMQCKSFR